MEKLKEKTDSAAFHGSPLSNELARQGEERYASELRDMLEPRHTGEFVAVHPESGVYFLGATGTEALSKAHAALPSGKFYLKKIGSKTAHKMGGPYSC